MNSPFALLFLSLQSQIADLADNAGNKYFKYVDQDLGQLEAHNGDNRPPVSWPCVLIDIDQMSFKSIGTNVQEGVGQFTIRIGFIPYSNTNVITPQQYREKALQYYDLEYKLHLHLQGATPGDITGYETLQNIFGAYDRLATETEQRSDLIRVRKLTYTIGMDDYSTKTAQTFTPAAIHITDQFDFNL